MKRLMERLMERFMGRALALAAVLATGLSFASHGQERPPERPPERPRAPEYDRAPAVRELQFGAEAGKPVRIGVYVNLKQDCTSGPLPTIRLLKAPGHGAVTVRRAKVRLNNHATCLAAEVPGYVAFYRSRFAFSGRDEMQLEVEMMAPSGSSIQRHNVVVTVRSSGIEL